MEYPDELLFKCPENEFRIWNVISSKSGRDVIRAKRMKLYAETEFPEGIAPSYTSLLRTNNASPDEAVKKKP